MKFWGANQFVALECSTIAATGSFSPLMVFRFFGLFRVDQILKFQELYRVRAFVYPNHVRMLAIVEKERGDVDMPCSVTFPQPPMNSETPQYRGSMHSPKKEKHPKRWGRSRRQVSAATVHLRYVHISLALLPSLMPRIFRELSARIKALGGNRQGVVFMDIAPQHISSDVVRAASECGLRMVKTEIPIPPPKKKHSHTQSKTTQNKNSGTTWPRHMGSIFLFLF